MTDPLDIALAAGLLVAALVALWLWLERSRRNDVTPSTHRILFPFVGRHLSERALDATLRLAQAEHATVVPAFLARVPMQLPLDAPLPRQANLALPLLEAIEQRATENSIPVDSRIERGRTYRHAMRELMRSESFDRMVVAAATGGSDGFSADDVAWLLDSAPGEIVVLRPELPRQPV